MKISLNEEISPHSLSKISDSHKKYTEIGILIMVFIDGIGYGLAITLFPEVGVAKGLTYTFIGLVFSIFPVGSLFTSCLTGKLMRFHKKKHLLSIFLIGNCLAKLLFGSVYYIEDPMIFFMLCIIARFFMGFFCSAYEAVSVSLISETWPDQIVEKMSYYELILNCGLISGPYFGAFINYFSNFFWVLAIVALFHLFIGCIVIFVFLKIENLAVFKEKRESLKILKIIGNCKALVQIYFQSLFIGSIYFISAGFENHIEEDLSGSQILCAMIFSFNMIGFLISVLIVNRIYKKNPVRKPWFLLGSIIIIIFNNLFGPDPFLGIVDTTIQIVCVSLAFFMVGIGQGMITVLLLPEYKEILEEIFPDEPEELINDMAPGIYLTAFAIAEFQNPLVGGVVRDGLGFSWASALYSGTLAVYFVGYWGKIIWGERAYQEIRNGG